MPSQTSIARVREYMTPCPRTIDHDATLQDARALMIEMQARHLPVLQGGRLVGILSDRDIELWEPLLVEMPDRSTMPLVSEAMTEVVFTCGPDAHLHAVADEMANHKYGSAVIVDPAAPGQVVGVFTTTDALRALAKLAPSELSAAATADDAHQDAR